MKKNKIIYIFIIIMIITILFLIILKNKKAKNELLEEIIPQEEISEKQERETLVTLYFEDKESGELSKEVRIIDVRELANDPFKKLVEMLIDGPKSDKLKKVIPDGTKINNIYIQEDIIYIDLSKEFIENHAGGIKNESNTIYSIANTLAELNEVNFIRILIDGEENKEFKDKQINFLNNFEKNN